MYLNEWGPIAWELFHYITYSFKPELHKYYLIFFNSLYALIPCPHCSNDIKEILTSYTNYVNYNISDKNSLINWYIDIHNQVNKKLKNNVIFTRKEADVKYLNNNKLTISHERILKFINLVINIKGEKKVIDSGCFLKQNIIALCSIYPYGDNIYNPYLMYFINFKIISNDNYKDWFNTFKKIVLNPIYIKTWDNHKYPIRDLEYNNEKELYNLELFSKPENKILNKNDKLTIRDDSYSSIILVSMSSDTTIITKKYNALNNINSLYIYIEGVAISKNSTINVSGNITSDNIISNNSTKTINIKNKNIYKLEFKNIKINSIISLMIEFVNKTKYDKYIIKNICLIGS